MFLVIIFPFSGAQDCGYSDVVYCSNVVVGWRPVVRRRLRRRTPDLQPTTTLEQYTTSL